MAPGDHRPPIRRLTQSGVAARAASAGGVLVTVCDERGRTLPLRLARWLAEAAPARARGIVNVAVVSDARVRRLNREYRRLDYATDVLSFPAEGSPQRTQSAQRILATGATAGPRAIRTRRSGFDSVSSVSSVAKVVGSRPAAPFLGDIVIARGVARRQARAAGHGEGTELRVLALHGLLHLLGYDHEHDTGQMARLERQLRRRAGLPGGLIERAAR
jgi:probable rRNA maturation factor